MHRKLLKGTVSLEHVLLHWIQSLRIFSILVVADNTDFFWARKLLASHWKNWPGIGIIGQALELLATLLGNIFGQ